jgi:outer membrane receptor protein involved in Fe transport
MKLSKKSALRLGIAIVPFGIAALGFAAPALAQDKPAPEICKEVGKCADTSNANDTTQIIVTGTRIKQPNLESANPVAVLTGEQVFARGEVNLGDQLNDMPQLRNTWSQQNSTRSLGTRGINILDLRGLGSSRTLVLVNGRRHVAGDILLNGVSPDINTIPADLIDRVDVVTGGASAVYGSDAVAGVVNFILKDHYEGVQTRGQAGISKYGDAGSQYISVLAGKNFADGRGNIAISAEYSHNERYYGSERPAFSHVDGFVVTETDPAGSTNGAAGGFDRTYYQDIRSATISLGGMVAVRYPNALTPCGADYSGAAFTCAFLFQPDGSLVAQTGTRVGLGPNGNFIGGNGYSGREGKLLTFQPDLQRYNFNLIGHFEVSPAFVPFVEAKYSQTKAFGSVSGPFFSQGQTLGDSVTVAGVNDRSYASTTSAANGSVNREGIRLDNAYLSATARTTLAAQFTAAVNAGINPNTGTAFTTSAASVANKNLLLAQIADGSFRFSLRRNWLDLGIRDENIKRETFRVVAGVRGDFNDDWHYEVSANYGEHKETNVIAGNMNRQRYLLAVDSVRNSAGQIVCRSQVDAAYGGTDRAGTASVLAADIAACVPINPFGEGSVTDAARRYLTMSTVATGKITQFDLLGYVSGDTSGFFNLPGGPLAFSVGGEYRRETNAYDLDKATQAGYAFYNAIPSFSSPAFEVKEAYGELQAPILKDVPFFHELSLKGSGRIANYKGSTGTVYAYGGEAVWAPIQDITFRGTYSHSVRAPNLSELYSAQGQNFATVTDPCSLRNLATGSATRSANCTAAGRPSDYDYVYSSSLEIISGGNPGLKAEKSNSYTAGVRLEPRFIPGLSLSVDWYDITVNNVITSIGSAQSIMNLCYDSPTLNNPFCGLFQRAGASGGSRGEIPFRILEGSLLQASANFAKLKVRGIDTELDYRHQFDFGTLTAGLVWTHQIKNESYTNPADPTFVNVFVGELGDPVDQVNLNLSLKRGRATIGYQARWISAMYLNTYEDFNSVNGLPPQNTDYAPIKKYPNVIYHDVRFGFDVSDKLNLYLGVDNVADKKPPYGLSGVGAGSGIYDVRGRYMYAGFKTSF